MQIRWTKKAIDDLQALRIYVEQDKPQAAKKLVLKILSMVEEDLILQPGMGRPGRKAGTRELIIPGTPYLVPYRIKNNCLEVLRVLHGAMRWP
ncbi:MAG: type II toxin-antitoxin system RelE/ParE family toxin [Desulfobulbaceae bacterium]|nr:type II toxin-antitoxin system RelE/ParE family toxin [Desulfobulbaceae bacterium]MCK5544105.1 type II toxin-antitoxin system RelE/ParE family toxin [Desulfobulbaceae bacterium]